MDEDRLKHSYAVAIKMMEIASSKKLSQDGMNNCFLIGINHDIGYEFTDHGVNHNRVGGELLKNSGFKFWREVYYHGELTDEYSSMYLNILNQADMQVDKYGNDVGYEKRLADIESRYGKSSDVYSKCKILIDSIRDL